MPSPTSFADMVHDWQTLLVAVRDNAEVLPNIEPQRAALEAALAEVSAIKARQNAHVASRQEATQELKAALVKGRELAIALRGAVKANLGPKSERLVQFRVAPLRRRPRRAKTDEQPAESQPPVPAPAPAPAPEPPPIAAKP